MGPAIEHDGRDDALPGRFLINVSGESFATEISSLSDVLGALENSSRRRFRDENASAIAELPSERILIVAGPGAGKSFLFLARIEFWLAHDGESRVYVSSFVRKLVRDLQSDVDTRIPEEHRHRITVSTLHTLARSVVERAHGTDSRPYRPHVQIISADWTTLVWRDVLAFHPDVAANRYPFRSLESQLHTEALKDEPEWIALRQKYEQLSQFYNAVGFADLIRLAREAVEESPDLSNHDLWIIDEFQDFNVAEEHLIRELTNSASGVVIAGDDEQALYQSLKSSLPEMIISYYEDTHYANAMLPYCSRCSYHVCLAASSFISANRSVSAIGKVYLPLTVDVNAPKVQIVATSAPTSAVDYIKKFISDHQEELDAHIAKMESGEDTDPFLLILTPDKKVKFFRTSRANEDLLMFLAQWSVIDAGRSKDYQLVTAYCRVAWDETDNFALRKVLDAEKIEIATVHEWLVHSLEAGCALAQVPDERIAEVLEKCQRIFGMATSPDLSDFERIDNLSRTVRLRDPNGLGREIASHPFSLPLNGLDEEAEEVIQTAGSLSPVEMMSIVGSKGLSAQHVIIIGCDDVNLDRTSRLAFFVGMTRARQSLHLVVSMKAGGSTAVHPFVMSLPSNHCRYLVYKKTGRVCEALADSEQYEERIRQWQRVAQSRKAAVPRKRAVNRRGRRA